MIDKYTHAMAQIVLTPLAKACNRFNIKADAVTVVGFLLGVLSMVFIYLQMYDIALYGVILNRIFDGLDGSLAREQGISPAGGFLDIVLDFIFYGGVIFSFGLSNEEYLMPALFLVFSFIGTGSSFLAFSSIASVHNLSNPNYPNKALYYMSGITEGTETIAIFILMLLFPEYFAILAYIFGTLCMITTCMRIVFGYKSLRNL